MTKSWVWACTVAAALVPGACGRDRNPQSASASGAEIETVVQNTTFEHVFRVPNTGRDTLRLQRIEATVGEVKHVDSVIPPAGSGRVAIRVNPGRTLGVLNEVVRVEFAGNRPPLRLHVRRRVVAPVEVAPQSDMYFFVAQGEPARRELFVINHLAAPVTARSVASSNPVFRAALSPVEAGRRYQVSISLDTTAPVGRHRGTIRITTDHPVYRTLTIEGHADVTPVVSASLERLDYLRVEHAALDRVATAQRTVLVRKYRGTDFRVLRAVTDLSFLTVRIEPQKPGESYFVHVRIEQQQVPRGRFAGALRIETNDASVRELKLPIQGEIL